MKVLTIIRGASSDRALIEELKKAGAEPLQLATPGPFVVTVDEDDPRSALLVDIARRHGAPVGSGTRFDDEDIALADFVDVRAESIDGFPQPERDFGYRRETYDLSQYCAQCGVGYVQIAPFRLKKKPKFGKNSVVGLAWVEDAFFVEQSVYEAAFKPFGIGFWPVLDHRTAEPFSNIVQLRIDARATLDVNDPRLRALEEETCTRCGRKRYADVPVGFLPRPVDAGCEMFQTEQWFGVGGESWRLTYVGRGLRPLLGPGWLQRAVLPPFPSFSR